MNLGLLIRLFRFWKGTEKIKYPQIKKGKQKGIIGTLLIPETINLAIIAWNQIADVYKLNPQIVSIECHQIQPQAWQDDSSGGQFRESKQSMTITVKNGYKVWISFKGLEHKRPRWASGWRVLNLMAFDPEGFIAGHFSYHYPKEIEGLKTSHPIFPKSEWLEDWVRKDKEA